MSPYDKAAVRLPNGVEVACHKHEVAIRFPDKGWIVVATGREVCKMLAFALWSGVDPMGAER